MLKLVLAAASANANGVLSWRMEFLEFVCHIFALKALVKTQNMDILQYSEWYWLLLCKHDIPIAENCPLHYS